MLCSFLVIDVTPPSEYTLYFRTNLFEEIKRIVITIYRQIRDEKLQYDINRAAAKIFAF